MKWAFAGSLTLPLTLIFAPGCAKGPVQTTAPGTSQPSPAQTGAMVYKSVTGPVPAAAGEHYNRAIDFSEQGNTAGAIAEYSEAIKAYPQYLEAYFNRGQLRMSQRDLDAAVADFTEAIRIGPDFADGYVSRAQISMARGETDAAVSDLNKAIEVQPDNAKAYANRALAKIRAGNDSDAQRDIDKAISLDPSVKDDVESMAALLKEERAKDAANQAPAQKVQ